MHILLGILGSVISILVLLDRLSDSRFDFSWLNFAQRRRKKAWQAKVHADPLFSIDNPMESTACLMYAMAKCSGDISREQKQCMRQLFQTEFHLEEKKATDLLSSCSFLLKDEDVVLENLERFIQPSLERFDVEKKESALGMIRQVAQCEDEVSGKQTEFMSRIESLLSTRPEARQKTW